MSLCFHNKNRKNPFNFFDFLIECSERGGAASGTCAAGFGVCCVFLTSSCGSTVKENCTYIRYLRFNNVISVVEFVTEAIKYCITGGSKRGSQANNNPHYINDMQPRLLFPQLLLMRSFKEEDQQCYWPSFLVWSLP